MEFKASNNEAEYEVYCDLQLVMNQFHGEYSAKNEQMEVYLVLVQTLVKEFESFQITKISRNDNTATDALAALASSTDTNLRHVIPSK